MAAPVLLTPFAVLCTHNEQKELFPFLPILLVHPSRMLKHAFGIKNPQEWETQWSEFVEPLFAVENQYLILFYEI